MMTPNSLQAHNPSPVGLCQAPAFLIGKLTGGATTPHSIRCMTSDIYIAARSVLSIYVLRLYGGFDCCTRPRWVEVMMRPIDGFEFER
jgi:hypothetical protein